MEYRTLGKTNEKVSILGFGAMRLPTLNSNNQINEKLASEILSYGIDNGINIIDTAYSYHYKDVSGQAGNSEPFLGEFLEKGYREKVLLSTKLPSWNVEKEEDLEFYLNEQLKRLKTDYFDIYLLHALNEKNWEIYKESNVFDFIDTVLSDGRIKHIGFSTHSDFEKLVEIVDDYDKWEVVLTQVNYLDSNYQSGVNGLNFLKEHNIGNMIMEPLRGGRLVENIPPDIQNMWNSSKIKRSPVEWAFQYLWDMENVDCVLSGMNSMSQVKENIELASKSKERPLTEEDRFLIEDVAREYKFRKGNDCSECGYCMPCKEGINIPHCFREYNIAKILDNPSTTAMHYFTYYDDNALAHNCKECADCKSICPQMMNIPEELKKVSAYFGYEFNHF